MIPCVDPKASYLAHKDEIDRAIAEVLESGRYILGPNVESFENEFARYLGVRHAIGVGSGTEALHLALRACEIGAGDEVITTAHTAVATVAAIELAGAQPVLVDLGPGSFTIDPACIERMITPRTRAIIPVHLYGEPAEMEPILAIAAAHGLKVIEDCAQAHGARYAGRRVGSLGDIAAFSFYPTKNLGALGDGGLVATNDEQLADRCRLLREYGWAERNNSSVAGWNTRLDELQAAVLRAKLPHLDDDNGKRVRLGHLYRTLLKGSRVGLPSERPGSEHVFHLFVVRADDRSVLMRHLSDRGVSSLIHYPVPVHLQPAYRGRLRGADNLVEAERAAKQVLSLPLFPELPEADVRKVAEAVTSIP